MYQIIELLGTKETTKQVLDTNNNITSKIHIKIKPTEIHNKRCRTKPLKTIKARKKTKGKHTKTNF